MDPADRCLVGFKRHLRVETVPAEAVYLISERGVTVLSGSCIERLAPLLDGTRSFAQLTSELSAELATTEVAGLVRQLADAGLLDLRHRPAPRTPPPCRTLPSWPRSCMTWPSRTSPPVTTVRRPTGPWPGSTSTRRPARSAPRRWRSSPWTPACTRRRPCAPRRGLTPCTAATAALVGAGAAPGADGPAVSLVLCDDYLDPRLDEINAGSCAAAGPWLLAKPSGAESVDRAGVPARFRALLGLPGHPARGEPG